MSWDRRVACRDSDLDFTEITARTDPEITTRARATCATCPALMACLVYLETTGVAGFAGGMTEAQRKRWRARDGRDVTEASLVEVSEAAELTPELLDGVEVRTGGPNGQLTPQIVDVVRRMTNAGFTAEQIVERVGHEHLTHRAVRHIRHGTSDGLTARRKQRAIDDAEGMARRRQIRQWAVAHGVDVPLDDSTRLHPRIIRAYRESVEDGCS